MVEAITTVFLCKKFVCASPKAHFNLQSTSWSFSNEREIVIS